MVLFIGRGWGVINDLIIGYLSDRTRSSFGRRYPWMLAGSITLVLGFGLLGFISLSSNQLLRFTYYGGIVFILSTAYTSVVLPYDTLAAELTQDYNQPLSLVKFKAAFTIGANILYWGLAQIILARSDNLKQKYLLVAAICAIVSMLAFLLCIWGTSKRYKQMETQRGQVNPNLNLRQQLQITLSNFPFICVIGIHLCSWLSIQIMTAILPYFVINCMGLPNRHLAQMVVTAQGTAFSMLFVWSAIAKRRGKRAIYCMGIPLTIFASIGLCFLQPNQVGLMYSLAVIIGLGMSTAYIVPWSMLPDVVDFDELKTGQRREGIFYGLFALVNKIAVAISLFFIGQALDRSGFISTGSELLPPNQPDSALWTIRLLISFIPAFLLMGGLVWAYFYPITRSVHGDIRLKLIERRNLSLQES